MEYINESGRHVAVRCSRCRGEVWVPAQAMRMDPSPVTCGDCQHYLTQHPDVAEREFQTALHQSQQDMITMRAKWKAQDAERNR